MPTMKLRKAEVPARLRAAFPDYKGRTFRAEVATTVTTCDLNWSGGTRNSYALVPLADYPTPEAPHARLNPRAPWAEPREGQRYEIPRGFVVVERSIFCGKDLGLRIHVRPDDCARLLPDRADPHLLAHLLAKFPMPKG